MNDTSRFEVDRRRFLQLMLWLGFGAGAAKQALTSKGFTVRPKVFIDIHNSSDNPDRVADAFVRANSPTLMAMYAVFFPPFLDRWGRNGVKLIAASAEKEKTIYLKDHHRLDALPAVVSAHLLARSTDEQKEELCNTIASSLKDHRREVREIIIQNLISAVSPDVDSVRFFSINENVLTSIDNFIEESKVSHKLLSPLCLCTEFLLNARLVLSSNTNYDKITHIITKRLKSIQAVKVPHFRYASQLIDLHEDTFSSANLFDDFSLPAQRSEAILYWKECPPKYRHYLRHLALIHTRNIYAIWSTMTGKDNSYPEIMTAAQAERAFPKALAYLEHTHATELLPQSRNDFQFPIPINENNFKRFVLHELDDLLTHPKRYNLDTSLFQPNEEERLLQECAPFSKYKDKRLIGRILSDEKLSRWKALSIIIESGIDKAIEFSGMASLLCEIISRSFKPFPNLSILSKKEKSQILEESVEKSRQAEKERASSMDQLQEEIGSVVIPRKVNRKKSKTAKKAKRRLTAKKQ